jgi:hypothetical protein
MKIYEAQQWANYYNKNNAQNTPSVQLRSIQVNPVVS